MITIIIRTKKDVLEILGRYEICPAHDDGMKLCSLTGGIDENKNGWSKSSLIFAQKELEEESGINASKDRFVSLGTVKPSKSADTIVHLFAIELKTELPVKDPKGNGSLGEQGSYCKWISLEEAINCKDPLVHIMLLRKHRNRFN